MTGDECSCAACRRDAEPPSWKPEPYVSDYERGFAAGFRVGFEEGRPRDRHSSGLIDADGRAWLVKWDSDARPRD
jgi:hypothetical protein